MPSINGWVVPPFVCEKEDVHYWTNKVIDDGADEDCVFCTTVMGKLAHDPGSCPATLFEAERVREDAGLGPTGPAGTPTEIPAGMASLWSALTPGTWAGASGDPGGCSIGNPFRRFVTDHLGHRVYVGRYDSSDRVWLIDPEGPKPPTTYTGQWATKAQLAEFVAGGHSHFIDSIAKEVGDVVHVKPVAGGIGTFTMVGDGHAIVDTSDLTKRVPKPAGWSRPASGAYNLVDDKGSPIDVDGHQPPAPGRDQVYLVMVESGVGYFVLRSAGTLTPAATAATKLSPGLYQV